MHISEQTCQAFNLLCEAQDIEHELRAKRLDLAACEHIDKQAEQTINKSLASLNELVECCARVIHKHLHVTSQDVLRMCKEARGVYSSRVR